ncbi:hypothetical protein BD413DRAFT_464442 [Trametes elegans]|nr:hypothetical protein BD413DRAFT_464442 [Trametes elegans]
MRCLRRLPGRYAVVFVSLLGACTLAWRLYAVSASALLDEVSEPAEQTPTPSNSTSTAPPPVPSPLPPLYAQYHRRLLALPQHHWENDHPLPEEKFFFVAGHSRSVGWGNAMQEVLLNTYLAYKAGRSFVFANYTWNDNGSQYSDYNGKKIPSQIPYSAMIRGPSTGDPFHQGKRAHRAISRDYFEKICPDKLTIHRDEVQKHLANPSNAQVVTDAWLARLADVQDPCVESHKESGQLYDYFVFGDPVAMLEIWPSLSTSPVMTQFGWSSLVELGFDTNRELFLSAASMGELYLSSRPFTTNADRYSMIPGLMAIHVRRGDYDQHCVNLANWGSMYLAFTSFPEMIDRFDPPPRGRAKRALYQPRCYPNIQDIVEKVRKVRMTSAAQGVSKLYVMTNGNRLYLEELAAALDRDSHWDMIATSRDMVLTQEQRYVAQAVDMLVGQRAQIFIGNGFSTVTSNIVTMRMANHFPADSTRLW